MSDASIRAIIVLVSTVICLQADLEAPGRAKNDRLSNLNVRLDAAAEAESGSQAGVDFLDLQVIRQ